MARGEGADAERQHRAELRSILRRALAHAHARDKVRWNVVLLCSTPTGKVGRPSKALSLAEAESLLRTAEGSTMGAYVVLSLLTGARTEELRALTSATHTRRHRCPHTSWSGAPSAPAAPPRPGSRAAPGPTPPLPQRTTRTPNPSGSGARPRRKPLAKLRPRLRLRGRHAPGRGERPTRLPTDRGRCRANRQELDAPRAATQLRLPACPIAASPSSRSHGPSGTAEPR
jgi:hypothetical protein